MMAQIVPNHRQEELLVDRMLFVRTDGILDTMAKVPLIVAGLIVVAIAMPIQNSFSSTRSLDLIIYPDGSTHISSEIDVDALEPDFAVNLFGPSVDNFVAVNENGFLLSSEILGNSALVETFGSSTVSIEYDIHDLVSKEGRIWTFSIDSPSDYTLLIPENTIIVGMSNLPNDMEIIGEQTKLSFPSGPSEVNYVFGSSTPVTPPTPIDEPEFDYSTILIGGTIIAGAGAIGAVLFKRSRKTVKPVQTTKSTESIIEKPLDTQTIFNLRPEMRDDDKELIKFISENGGQALESELRKKFLQPRTTMWRAVKRLERLGVVEIEKKDLQNVVKLKKNLEDEE